VRSVHFYPFVVAIEKRDISLERLRLGSTAHNGSLTVGRCDGSISTDFFTGFARQPAWGLTVTTRPCTPIRVAKTTSVLAPTANRWLDIESTRSRTSP
jgi:hypothetical protein